MQPKTMPARFPGKCAKCLGRIAKGSTIVYTGVAWHPECYGQPTEPKPSPNAEPVAYTPDTKSPAFAPPINRPALSIRRFDSPIALADFCDTLVTHNHNVSKYYINKNYSSSWSGGCSYNSTQRDLRASSTKYVDVVLAELQHIDLPDSLSAERQTVSTHWGTRVSMSDWATGAPMMFRRRQRVLTDHAPVHIMVDLWAVNYVSPASIIRRGAIALAIVERLQAIRPVTFTLLCSGNCVDDRSRHTYIAIDIGTSPINVSEWSFALCDPGFYRILSMGAKFNIANTRDSGRLTPSQVRADLALGPEVVYVGGIASEITDSKDYIAKHYSALWDEATGPNTQEFEEELF